MSTVKALDGRIPRLQFYYFRKVFIRFLLKRISVSGRQNMVLAKKRIAKLQPQEASCNPNLFLIPLDFIGF
jgi:hypothetical protein